MRTRLPKIFQLGLLLAAALLLFAPAERGQSQTAQPVAAAKRPMTFADLMALKRISDPQISPSGKWVLFSVTDVSLEKNSKTNHLWVVPLASGPTPAQERQVTFGDGESNGRFSPDGKWISLSMKDQVYLAPWDDASGKPGDAKQLTSVAGGADGAIWSPDSRHLLLTADVYPECSLQGGAAVLAHIDPAQPRKLGTLNPIAVAGLQPAVWPEEDACDKAKDEAAAKDPVKAQVWDSLLYRHWNAFTGLKRTHILVVDANNGATVRDMTPANVVGDAETPTFSLGGPLGYAWAPDSREIAYVTNLDAVPAASTNNDVFTLRLNEQAEPLGKHVKISTSPGSDDGPAYSPDGKYLAFRSQARAGFESDRFRLMLFDRDKKTTQELMPHFDGWVDEFMWERSSKELIIESAMLGKEVPFSVDLQGGSPGIMISLFATCSEGLQTAETSEIQPAPDGRTFVASRMSAEGPTELVVFSFNDAATPCTEDASRKQDVFVSRTRSIRARNDIFDRPLTHVNDTVLKAVQLPAMESFLFPAADGTKVQGFLIRPPNFDHNKKYPLKFLMHGGPQGAWGDAWSYRWNPELMAASGYVVVMVNPRGSTGYGQKFVDEVSGDWGGKPYTDLMRGLDYAEAHYPFIDKARECALGASYGGYMADWVLTHTNRFQCIVTHDGMYDAESAYGSTEEMWFNEWEFRRSGATGATAWDPQPGQPWRYSSLPAAEDPFRKWSPSQYIQNAKTPTLIIHSQKDYRLDVSQGFELFTALQRRSVPSKFLYFPDEGHWVLKPQNSQLWYQTVGDWCDRWTHSGKYAATSP